MYDKNNSGLLVYVPVGPTNIFGIRSFFCLFYVNTLVSKYLYIIYMRKCKVLTR